jgi:hypothetical protein
MPSSANDRPTHTFEELKKTIQPGDVVLVEGKQRISTAIKYLTQSNWSHSALCIEDGKLIEADLEKGVILVPLEKYQGFHTRVCRPHGVSEQDLKKVITFAKKMLGHTYDLKNIFDLLRYLIPTPPIPSSLRRKVLAFGSGDPTKAICSSMIAQSFQIIKYPIIPFARDLNGEIHFTTRHHSLITPSDFDRSPYFDIVKPTIEQGFDFKTLRWSDDQIIMV